MKLVRAQVKKFRNYVDSKELKVEDSITSLIGKNESGKTAFLKALYSIKPDNPNEASINVIKDYPRWFKVRDGKKINIEDVSYIITHFSLNDNEISKLSEIIGTPIPKNAELCIERKYSGDLYATIDSNKEKLLKSLWESNNIEEGIKKIISDTKDIDIIINKLESSKEEKIKKRNEIEDLNVTQNEKIEELNSQKNEENSEEITNIEKKITENNELINKNNGGIEELDNVINSFEAIKNITDEYLSDEKVDEIKKLLPEFFYFGSYNTLKGRIDLDELIKKDKSKINKEDQTALALLKLADVTGQKLMDSDYEIRKAELEAAASEITRQVLSYWTQNKKIFVDLDNDAKEINEPNGQKAVHRFLDVRLRDQRHDMTTNFSTRSTGFQWFFSFLVAFSDFCDREDVIILLDEPGLGLHGSAQGDLLNFIEKELAKGGRQVIYTNHSPFMVNPTQLERVRLVEDNTSRENPDLGAKILNESLDVKTPETLFPLQAALGYDIAQNLFIGQYTLIVEGPSDYIYLDLLSNYLKEKKKISLDDKIIITPVGGADKIPTFVALLGTHLDVTVLVDANMKNNQKLQDLINLDILKEKRLINVGQVTANSESANTEDLFSDEEYLSLYNEADNTSIKPEDIPGDESIVTRIEEFIGHRYNHYAPLKVLQRDLSKLDKLSPETLERFEKLFDILNNTYGD